MKLALKQAKKNLGNTKDNPAVGCIIVKNNCVLSAGTTEKKGTAHAEYNAINSVQKNVKDSDLYVSLEPCSHYGKTPPCVKNIIDNKIRRVFFSIKDPDVRSYNKSIKKFKENKIPVISEILYTEIKNFYRSYFAYKNNKLPFVTAKLAISKDYYSKEKNNKWITNEFSRGRVHLMRSNHDCILTSVKTVIDDNPYLTCRISGLIHTSPSRFILDKKLKIPLSSNIIKTVNTAATIIFFNKINKKKIKRLKKLKVKLIRETIDKNGNFYLKNILTKIKKLGFSRIFLETGLKLSSNFLKEGLVNDFKLFVSNKNLEKNGSKSFKKNIRLFFKNKKFYNEKVNLLGDKLISYRLK